MRRFALVLATLLVAACGDSTAPGPSPVGTYWLATVNGNPLPQLAARTASGDMEVVAASLALYPDGTYASTYGYRPVASPNTLVSQQASGQWSVSNGVVTLAPFGSSPSSVNTLRWEGDTLTLVDANATIPVTLVFKR